MIKAILLVAALPEEADAFRPGEGRIIATEPHPVRLIEDANAHIKVVTCGLGKVNAALAVGLHTDSGTKLIAMTGTCGKIGQIEGDCFWIAKAIQHDYGACREAGFVHYRAGDWPMGEPRDLSYAAMPDIGLGLQHAAVASGDAFLECSETAEALAQRLDAQLVDMEVAAVAQAAEALGVPWAAIKAVTDGADGESAGDFSANLHSAARKAGEAMERLAISVLGQFGTGAVG